VDFKKEIEEKFTVSQMKSFIMPRASLQSEREKSPESILGSNNISINRQRNNTRYLA
jgi:hypothetical protein